MCYGVFRCEIFFLAFAVFMGVLMEGDGYLMVCYNCGHGTYRRGEDVYDTSPRPGGADYSVRFGVALTNHRLYPARAIRMTLGGSLDDA